MLVTGLSWLSNTCLPSDQKVVARRHKLQRFCLLPRINQQPESIQESIFSSCNFSVMVKIKKKSFSRGHRGTVFHFKGVRKKINKNCYTDLDTKKISLYCCCIYEKSRSLFCFIFKDVFSPLTKLFQVQTNSKRSIWNVRNFLSSLPLPPPRSGPR